jgi:acetoin utilization protein AcuB
MLVRDRMTPQPTTITAETNLKDALELIRSRRFRHLPVVDDQGRLIGITTEKDLVYASPRSDLSLSNFEVTYLLSRITVGQIMKQDVITVSPDLPIEEAARVMVDHRIGCLPVVEEGRLIGIISDTDIFRVFVEGLGGGHPSLRVTVVIPEQVGSLARVVSRISALGANIHSLGTFWASPTERILAVRVEGADRQALLDALQTDGVTVRDVWEHPDRP